MTVVESIIFACAFLVSFYLFLRRTFRLLAMVLLGKPEARFDRLRDRLKALLLFGFGQKKVVEEPFGVNHFFLFWGFILLQLFVNGEFIVAGIFPRFSLNFLGPILYPVVTFVADFTSLLVLLVIIIAVIRRLFFKPPHVERSLDAFFILTLVLLLMVAYFTLNIAHSFLGMGGERFVPISRMLAIPFVGLGSAASWHVVERLSWWLHAVVLLVFMVYIPYSKHLHILTALINCFFRRFSFVQTLPPMVFKKGEQFGVSNITQFTWKDLLDFLSCTECGRCADACPATNTGKVLDPKQVILAGKANLMANGEAILAARGGDTIARADETAPVNVPLIGRGRGLNIQPEAIWDCTTCGACVEKCPVFIEQFPKLLQMRRHLVMEKVEFPPELITFFQNMEQRSNPFGIAPTERAKWAAELDVPFSWERPDAEYLFYIGCVASFSSRMKNVMLSIVRMLQQASISFAILGREEQCCGDPLRRLGNEYVFDKVAKSNIALLKKYGVKKMLTLCPHCYSTFKHDYRDFGADFEVIHHTVLLHGLLKSGQVQASSVVRNERIVFHDSCYLGRYNDIYDEPRSLIERATGAAPLEMEKRRREGFCCGAGGGRMWMEESSGTRINADRTRQALHLDPTIIATCCPYCMTMFEDGIKDEKAEARVRVLDVSEILAGSLA
ncbi:MAG: electron transfer flavoprotein-associated cytochrome b and domain pair iron-sulfur [Deltaproteobacteria bacterium]|nr:electron transfer flavoprotein-associated cytochrome b and domain pair iron-sulfur [Deltaproteobacteria bacterium]